jgi:putative glycerol-1-phosphate prenyltransferase
MPHLQPWHFFTFFALAMNVLQSLIELRQQQRKTVAVLMDPDDPDSRIREVATAAVTQGIEWFLVGGSLITQGKTDDCVQILRQMGAKHIVLFPGHEIQVSAHAHAILFLSLVSGRNPEFLIGKQVAAAPWVKKAGLETLPTAYMLVESGKLTSALYMSHTIPLPNNKPDIAAATALAAEMMGMKVFYMDAGSGADAPIPASMIRAVRDTVEGVLFAGGGIRSAAEATQAWQAGADMVVVGNGAFANANLLAEIAAAASQFTSQASS